MRLVFTDHTVILIAHINTFLDPCDLSTPLQVDVFMSLRTQMQRAMAADSIASRSRSRSPQRDQHTTSSRPSPFFRPPGWQPPVPQSHWPIILQIDLKSVQQLALRDPDYNILSPQVAGNLSTEEYDSLFQGYLPGICLLTLCGGHWDLGCGPHGSALV